MAKRLAITIAGAVSLGSYEAGVMWEMLDAIRQHNADAATQDGEKIVVDVATGASAGGMTAVILAQKLMYYGNTFAGPYDNPLYDTWVKRINLVDLQDTQADELATHSLFSSDLIEAIAEDVLLTRYAAAPTAARVAHGTVEADAPFRVGVAMTNMDGVDYGYPIRLSEDQFIYREYADEMTRTILPGSDTVGFWTPLREAAVACGAFPVAFRSKDLQRDLIGLDAADYDSANRIAWTENPRLFTYSDGGIVQNQPLGMAKNLVDEKDNHLDQENRFYLFVSPHAKEPTPDNYHEANGNYGHLALQLAKVVMGQAGFRDWITAEGVNQRVCLMDTRAKGLMQGILDGSVAVGPLQSTASALLSMLFPGGANLAPGAKAAEGMDAAQGRIASQYAAEMTRLAGIDGAGEAFRDSMTAFEAAAGLGARDEMKIYGVTANDSQLAGAGVQSFLGFFDEAFRTFDYEVGRSHARVLLQNPNLAKEGELGPIRFDAGLYPLPAPTVDLAGLKLAEVQQEYPGDLSGFEDGLKSRVDEMLDETIPHEAERVPAKIVTHGILKSLLAWLVRTQ